MNKFRFIRQIMTFFGVGFLLFSYLKGSVDFLAPATG
jgi:hypothetical protein